MLSLLLWPRRGAGGEWGWLPSVQLLSMHLRLHTVDIRLPAPPSAARPCPPPARPAQPPPHSMSALQSLQRRIQKRVAETRARSEMEYGPDSTDAQKLRALEATVLRLIQG